MLEKGRYVLRPLEEDTSVNLTLRHLVLCLHGIDVIGRRGSIRVSEDFIRIYGSGTKCLAFSSAYRVHGKSLNGLIEQSLTLIHTTVQYIF